ncbi:macrolide ABC transporter ATP-binding protein [Candidatus Shapirobacteria bacterium]|nr:MAG: macrolide ABC transporter ATP-binding protein [Candidatus Shapirobacteria bacterium]
MPSSPILSLSNINKFYGQKPNLFQALKNINLKIYSGDFISITGPSGSGKSTLMHIIGLLDNPSSGQIFLNKKDVSKLKEKQLAKIRNQKLGFVFQQFNLLKRTSSLDNVILPLIYSDLAKKEHKTRGLEMLKKVSLSDKIHNTPAQLSGGQQQRVAIARALVNQPQIILADEPTGNLDSKSGQQIIKLLIKLNQEGHTVILVTHDPKLAKIAKKVIIIKDGKIC